MYNPYLAVKLFELTFIPLKYQPKNPTDFFKTLKNRTDNFFDANKKERQGDYRMYIKTAVMLTCYLVPYSFITFVPIENPFLYTGLWIIMGVFMAGIGLSIMHDAIHGSYSKNNTVNKIIGEVINLVGGAAINWKIQHNVLHHTYTNIDEYDMDIDGPSILRFSPNQPLKKIHRFQYIYAWLMYGLLTLNWSTYKDFNSILRYKKMGLIGGGKNQFAKELFKIIFTKILYFTYIIVLPFMFSGEALLTIILNFLLMHWVCGTILGSIFQPAHVMETSDFPLADQNHIIHNDWAAHQLINTVNFARSNRVFSWFVGGLNYQVEHHLFPNICHVHYRDLSKIVKNTAEEFGLPYNEHKTFAGAIWYHTKMLKKLGRA